MNVNNCTINVAESSSKAHGLREEEDNQGSPRAKTNKKKNTYKKRKVGSEVNVLCIYVPFISLSLHFIFE